MLQRTRNRSRDLAPRILTAIRHGLARPFRLRRYIRAFLAPFAAIWLVAMAYALLAPEYYTSRFILILPGSGAGGTIAVDDIGQAQASVASAFASATLSPTENYKRLLMADLILRRAAQRSRDPDVRLPNPHVKLIDQTNLIEVEINGPTARRANLRASALRAAFLEQLGRLRRDEAAKREASDTAHLADLARKVRTSQQRLFDFQSRHGLVSMDQFASRMTFLDTLAEKEREARTVVQRQSAESSRFTAALGAATPMANATLRLRSDPLFQKLAEQYAAATADSERKAATLGPAHRGRAQVTRERDTLRAAIVRRGRELTGLGEAPLLRAADMTVSDGRSSLMAGMIARDVEAAGAKAALTEIRADLARQKAASTALVEQASTLADLTREHRIAEAVFSSALARLDINKQDPFASYPLVQTLEEPSLPLEPSGPSLLLSLIAAVAANIVLLVALVLLWLRQPIIRKILPNS
jgi:uncharacterized protein involved in exopolysaccharide biosynthesis